MRRNSNGCGIRLLQCLKTGNMRAFLLFASAIAGKPYLTIFSGIS